MVASTHCTYLEGRELRICEGRSVVDYVSVVCEVVHLGCYVYLNQCFSTISPAV